MPTGFNPELNPAFRVFEPAGERVAFVLNSPHSGRSYPEGFLKKTRLDQMSVRKSEDFLVDELVASGVEAGMPLLTAIFPRAFLDVNREPYELDPRLFKGRLPHYANTRSVRVASGLGTIARIVAEGEEIYHERLSIEEGLQRIEAIYKPYHAALRQLLAETQVMFGFAVLIDCHSMPSFRNGPATGIRPDIVIGDRYGSACAPEITHYVRDVFQELGYRVDVNRPYAGGFITEHYGRPEIGLHAIQIELNRGLYMDEHKIAKSEKFDAFAEDLQAFFSRIITMPQTSLAGDQPLAAE